MILLFNVLTELEVTDISPPFSFRWKQFYYKCYATWNSLGNHLYLFALWNDYQIILAVTQTSECNMLAW